MNLKKLKLILDKESINKFLEKNKTFIIIDIAPHLKENFVEITKDMSLNILTLNKNHCFLLKNNKQIYNLFKGTTVFVSLNAHTNINLSMLKNQLDKTILKNNYTIKGISIENVILRPNKLELVDKSPKNIQKELLFYLNRNSLNLNKLLIAKEIH